MSDAINPNDELVDKEAGELGDEHFYLTDAQLRAELDKCEYCEEKPCKEACPCDCSPMDFIKAVEIGLPSDYQRSAALIMGKNPLGGICGLVCPDHHCMAACVHKELDGAVNIPQVQATVVQRAKELGVMPRFERADENGKRVAVIGGGPAGLAAASMLALKGYGVTIFEKGSELGGMCLAIPEFRLDRRALRSDIEWLLGPGGVDVELDRAVDDPASLFDDGFDAVLISTGLWTPFSMGIANEDAAIAGTDFLANLEDYAISGNVAVIGGGATAFDAAMSALDHGADRVELIALESLGEMPLSTNEFSELIDSPCDVNGRRRVSEILMTDGKVSGLVTNKVSLVPGTSFSLANIEDVPNSTSRREDIDQVIIAIGNRSNHPKLDDPRVFYAGDCVEGPTTVVEASGAGKNTAEQVHAFLNGLEKPAREPRVNGHVKSRLTLPGYNDLPVPLETDFFGRTILSPFLLSAAPPTDGLDQMRLAYEAGWAGGIMKTAFDGIPIHIPSEYMFTFNRLTYANCDNVSGHALDRVCREIGQLVTEWPDRLTIGSTGGPVTGNDDADRLGWAGNTKKLENAGAMAIEYSLSCPQGGDGTEGDMAAQSAALTAKIIDWVLADGRADVPKLFKLTGAVTSIEAIVMAVKEVFDRYPDKKAGVTLANTFPSLAFRSGAKKGWDEGIIVGMSGDGVRQISNLSLAKVAHLGVDVSGNGGPMDYKAAADFLALGAKTVQFCSIAMKFGYGIHHDLTTGLSHLMAARGLDSVDALIGAALPDPITDFMALTPDKKLSAFDRGLCLQCGNCGRCPYLAITFDQNGYPKTDPSRCVGCGFCAQKCFADAIYMRERTAYEAEVLVED